MDKYYRALGRFITGFSMVEGFLIRLLWREAELKPPLAPALMHGLRVAGAIETLTRVHEATGTTVHPALQSALDQLATINTARNWIVHWGLDKLDPDAGTVSNKLTSHWEGSLREIPVSTASIGDMTRDLETIGIMLMGFQIPDLVEKIALEGVEMPTWLYKFPQSRVVPPKSQKKRDKPPRQRKPSKR